MAFRGEQINQRCNCCEKLFLRGTLIKLGVGCDTYLICQDCYEGLGGKLPQPVSYYDWNKVYPEPPDPDYKGRGQVAGSA